MSWKILHGDCRERMATMADASVDAIVTDPPAGIAFMGKEWDDFRRSRNDADTDRPNVFGRTSARGPEYARRPREAFVAWMTLVAAECLRVARLGAHALVWAIPRTSHWTATAWEDAGWEVRDRVSHLFGSGFPKSLDVSKAIDKAAGADRAAAGISSAPNGKPGGYRGERYVQPRETRFGAVQDQPIRTDPATDDAKQWQGFGTALKPAVEDWWLLRKPLSGTVAANVLEHGTGALNIDGCRIATEEVGTPRERDPERMKAPDWRMTGGSTGSGASSPSGRWPANLVLSHTPDCVEVGTRTVKGDGHYPSARGQGGLGTIGHGGQDGLSERSLTEETVTVWDCAPGCAVAMLDEQSGELTSGANPTTRQSDKFRTAFGDFAGQRECVAARGQDSGGASRFFYCGKITRNERDAGLDDMPVRSLAMSGGAQLAEAAGETYDAAQSIGLNKVSRVRNNHPTVKPVDLMRWLCRLITPPGGTILDPFAGSGSTLIAALREGFHCIGIEQDAGYVEIARRRIEGDCPLFNTGSAA